MLILSMSTCEAFGEESKTKNNVGYFVTQRKLLWCVISLTAQKSQKTNTDFYRKSFVDFDYIIIAN